MNKIYILLKDTPSHEKGEEFYYREHREVTKCYCSAHTVNGFQLMFPKDIVENSPEWFKLKEEKVWTDSDMIEFARKYTGDTRENLRAGLYQYKIIDAPKTKLQNP